MGREKSGNENEVDRNTVIQYLDMARRINYLDRIIHIELGLEVEDPATTLLRQTCPVQKQG